MNHRWYETPRSSRRHRNDADAFTFCKRVFRTRVLGIETLRGLLLLKRGNNKRLTIPLPALFPTCL